jgi:hypothetical protein
MSALPGARLNASKLPVAIAVCAITLYLALSIASATTKRPWCDEAWFASPALNLATKGTMGTSVLEPYGWLKGIDQYTYWVTPLYLVTQAGWYKIFGFSLLSMRGLSMVWGLIALASWFLIMKTFSADKKLALLTMGLLAVDYFFVMFSSTGRMDMMSASLGFAAFAAYLHLRERSLKLAVFVSQALVAASGLTHPYGILPFAGLLFLTLYYDRSRLGWRHAGLAAIPYLIGGVAWGLYIMQEPQLFFAQFTGNINGTLGKDRWIGLSSPLTALKMEIVERYLGSFGFARLKVLVLAAYVIALAGALATPAIRRHRGYRALLTVTAIYFAIMTIFEGSKVELYIIHVVPLYTAILAVWIRWCWMNRALPRFLIAGGVAALVTLQLGGIIYLAARNDYQNRYLPVITFLKERAATGDLIMGSAELGFQLGFADNLVDDTRFGFLTGKKPDYLVVEKQYAGYIEMYRAKMPEMDRHVSNLLGSELQLVYQNAEYQVYARPQVTAKKTGRE